MMNYIFVNIVVCVKIAKKVITLTAQINIFFEELAMPLKFNLHQKNKCLHEEDFIIEDEQNTWDESEAAQVVQEGDIVVIRSGDNFYPYYLLYALNCVEDLIGDIKDDYGHLHLKGSVILKGHYLEEIQQRGLSRIFYKDEKEVAIISAFTIAGISPPFVNAVAKRRCNAVTTFEVKEFIYDIFTGLVTGYNI